MCTSTSGLPLPRRTPTLFPSGPRLLIQPLQSPVHQLENGRGHSRELVIIDISHELVLRGRRTCGTAQVYVLGHAATILSLAAKVSSLDRQCNFLPKATVVLVRMHRTQYDPAAVPSIPSGRCGRSSQICSHRNASLVGSVARLPQFLKLRRVRHLNCRAWKRTSLTYFSPC